MNGDEKERQFHTNSDLAWYLLPEIELHTESYRQCLYKDFFVCVKTKSMKNIKQHTLPENLSPPSSKNQISPLVVQKRRPKGTSLIL